MTHVACGSMEAEDWKELKTLDANLRQLYDKWSALLPPSFPLFTCSDLLQTSDLLEAVSGNGKCDHLVRPWSAEAQAFLKLQHWVLVKHTYSYTLNSSTLQEVFQNIETTPLLPLLEDFLPQLDSLFLKNESQGSREPEGGSHELEGGSHELEGGDEEYVEVLELYCLLRQRLLDVRYNWGGVAASALAEHGKYAGFAREHYPALLSALDQLLSHCSAYLQRRCHGNEKDPRLVRLCRKLCLSEKEQQALDYIFIQNVGVLFAKLHSRLTPPSGSSSSFSGSRPSSMAVAAAAFAGMTGREMLEFLDEARPILKQELLEPDDEFSSIATTAFLRMPSTLLKACCGCTLTAEELYKVDKTAMAEVLGEEQKGVGPEESERKAEKPLNEAPPTKPLGSEESGGGGDGVTEGESEGDGEEVELSMELEEILKTCDQIQQQSADDSTKSTPYKTDLEYLEDNFELIETRVKAMKTEMSDNSLLLRSDQRKPEAVLRELRAKARGLRARIDRRMEATHKSGAWLPRLERLAELRGLDLFEKSTLLILTGSMVSRNLRNPGNHGEALFGHHLSIGSLIGLFCDGLQEQIQARVYFYKNSKLVTEGLIHVSEPPLHARGNFLDSSVELDRRLLDYIVGLDTEINELVDGSDLYTPSVSLGDVALPPEHRQLLVSTFQSFGHFQRTCKELGLNTKGVARGLTLLFYGPSGTGKTMTANAVADHLGKKVLLVTVSAITEKELSKELLRFLFREAKIHNAILFFDECEPLFESRDHRPNPGLGLLLPEIEQYEGIIVMATNRHQDLDEAMHRRIQLALPFTVPDYALRAQIWQTHVPAAVASPDISWTDLALSHELTGGLIRNAVLAALAVAINESGREEGEAVKVKQEHLMAGARLQLRGLLEMVDFERRVIPTFGLGQLVLAPPTLHQLQQLLNAGKTHKFLSAQWGFSRGTERNVASSDGLLCLLCGGAGSGKTAVAHAIAYELGQPVKEASCTELLSHTVTANPRMGRGVATFFRDAQKANAIIVLDGVDVVLSSAPSGLLAGLVGCEGHTLLHQIEHFPGMVVLTTRRGAGLLDLSRLPKLRFVLELSVPSADQREQLWRQLLPEKAPLASDISCQELAERFEFTGGEIASAICAAAELAAGQEGGGVKGGASISHGNLLAAAEQEWNRKQLNTSPAMSIFQ